ncbi:MAG: ChuX/HutX family heme-like substrate-binding protein, partial [Rubricoccaceae bacterium]|nr:ChuX/HutX family heme-like substrate-binding protein [Rubricoccaceae bacterium]
METLAVPANLSPQDIREAAVRFKAENPKARARNVADGIGVSEAELLASRIGQPNENVFRLKPDFKSLLMELETLGPLMALTRNDNCVHEKTGLYDGGQMDMPHKMGLFLDDPIDLRLFFHAWSTAFFVQDGDRLSFQFFDPSGTAVHKVYAVKETDRLAMTALAERFVDDNQSSQQPVSPIEPAPEAELSEETITEFLEGWRALKDTHDFFPLLKTHGVSRRQAVRVAPEDLVRKVDNRAHRRIRERASASGLAIMVFVGN